MWCSLFLVSQLVLGQPAADGSKPAEAATSTAEEKAAAEAFATKVRALLKQLDSNDQAQREAAEKDLIALGEDVLPRLPSVGSKTPAEVKNRLTRIRQALASVAIEATAKASLVTLDGVMQVPDALALIAKQTGNKLIDYRMRFSSQELPSPQVKLTLNKAPFWEALDTVLDVAELQLYTYDEDDAALAYIVRSPDAGPRLGKGSYSGVFRLEPIRVDSMRDLRNSAARSLKVTVDVAWEPRVRPVVLELKLSDLSAKDETGELMAIDASEEKLEIPVEGKNAGVELEIPLILPARSVKQVKMLKGKLTAVVLGRVESFEFTDLEKAKDIEQERGGVTVIVDRSRKNDELFDVNVRVKFDKASNALESHRGWIYNNESYLLDPKGNRVDNAGLEANLLEDNEVGLSYKFDLGEAATTAGYKFIYKTPAAIIRVPVDFELKDIELP